MPYNMTKNKAIKEAITTPKSLKKALSFLVAGVGEILYFVFLFVFLSCRQR